MTWWGKAIGGAFGFMLGGPLGALFGAALGHGFDRGLGNDLASPDAGDAGQEQTQAAFFTATFSVMGHLAKADGQVSEAEIALANAVMQQMALNEAQTRLARELFKQGKQPGFDLPGVVQQLKRECHRRHNLLQMFLEIQLHAAFADGDLHRGEKHLLQGLAAQLGFASGALEHIEALVRAQRHFGDGNNRKVPPGLSLTEAYAILGVSDGASEAELKKAYRRLMSQHHPDKLVAKGLPEEMVKMATTKTQEIMAAYELVKQRRANSRSA